MEGEGERKRKTGPIQLDWAALMPYSDSDDEPPPEVVIQEVAQEKSNQPVMVTVEMEEEESQSDQYLRQISDEELRDKIDRVNRFLVSANNLSDGGDKLLANLKRQEAELERRTRMKEDNKRKEVTLVAVVSTCNGATDDLSHSGTPPSAPALQFGLRFCSKLDNEKATKCSSKGLSTLNCFDHKNIRENAPFAAPRPQKIGSSSRQTPFKSPSHLSVKIDNCPESSVEDWGSYSSNPPTHQADNNVSGFSGRKESATCGQPPPNTRRNNKTLVLLDEEELEVDLVNKEEKVAQRIWFDWPVLAYANSCFPFHFSCKETRIYYPSRDDPKAVEICYSDMECLAPESYLSSPIMNFYIRYLQKPTSPRARRRCDYHIFNTYFYKKLKHDVLTKADKETSFLKFRRWWRGVNIFEKAHIFLPIHENQHWSLVIICIPDKEEESGPIVLHLDSLSLHNSKSIFNNVKSFIIEEWKFLRQEELLPELPIPEKIWDKLSRRITEKVIKVPQQKNEYDCGIFALFFMERFLEEAPERLKREDFEMFGREWFKPEEASSLRRKIRDLLQQEFNNVNEGTS